MLTGTVHARKGLLVQQASESMAFRQLFHRFHYNLIVVYRNIGRFINGSKLMLRRSRLIMLRFGSDAQLPQFNVQILHESAHALPDNSEVMILQLLSLRRRRSEQRTACENQILSFQIFLAIHQEILLLRSHGSRYLGSSRIPEQLNNTQRLLPDCFHGTKQRCFLIQRLARIGTEGGGNTENHPRGILLQESGRGNIPRRIASCFKGGPQAS